MSGSNRRQPTRSARTSTTRPTNYYQPFGTRISQAQEQEIQQPVPHGFFPAIQHFTDGIAALPKEVMRHMTLLKETEGKSYQPYQAISGLIDRISNLPPPPKTAFHPHPQAFFGFSYNNSLNGSAPPSIVDGSLPATQPTQSDQMDLTQTLDEHQDVRRRTFFDLRERMRESLLVLDEKNMVLCSANDTLARQLDRLDSILPHVEKEVSEEARLGSNTHWALPHMKEARRPTGPTNDRSRRDVQAANSLAAAAAVIHENDIAAARSEARREAMVSKRRQNVDSDFDERQPPKRSHAGTKSKKTISGGSALDAKAGNAGQPAKRRRVDKDAAPAMERSISAALHSRPGTGREAGTNSRNAQPNETRKKPKPLPSNGASKKRNSVHSPQITSSPTRGTFATTALARNHSPAATNPRPGVSRGRQNSALSTKSSAQDRSGRESRPTYPPAVGRPIVNDNQVSSAELRGVANVTGRSIGEARSAMRDTHTTSNGERLMEQEGVQGALVVNGNGHSHLPKRDEAEVTDIHDPNLDGARMRSNAGAPGSKPPTPLEGNGATIGAAAAGETTENPEAPAMGRSRSTRGAVGNNATTTTAPSTSKRASASSPAPAASYPRRAQFKGAHAFGRSTPAADADADPEAELSDSMSIRAGADNSGDNDGSEGASSPGSDEPRYCICNQPSYGSMVACDNPACPHEWFHLECVGLSEEPMENTKWYCEECKRAAKRGRGATLTGPGGR